MTGGEQVPESKIRFAQKSDRSTPIKSEYGQTVAVAGWGLFWSANQKAKRLRKAPPTHWVIETITAVEIGGYLLETCE